MRDPHRAINSRPADRAMPLCNDLTRLPTAQFAFFVNAVEIKLLTVYGIQNPRRAISRIDFANDGLDFVGGPIDGTVVLLHHPPQLPPDLWFGIVQRLWLKVATLNPAYSFQHALNCRLRNLAPIETGLAGLTHRKIMGRPNVSSIHLFGGL